MTVWKNVKNIFIVKASHWFPYIKKRIQIVHESFIELNPLETACDELRRKCIDFELCLSRKDSTLIELYLQGGLMPQVHKGPLAYAEAFLEPSVDHDLENAFPKYSKLLKRRFKLIFKRLIELYQRGIDLYDTLNPNKDNKLYIMLQEKLNECENTFRNLLLIDGVSRLDLSYI